MGLIDEKTRKLAEEMNVKLIGSSSEKVEAHDGRIVVVFVGVPRNVYRDGSYWGKQTCLSAQAYLNGTYLGVYRATTGRCSGNMTLFAERRANRAIQKAIKLAS